MTQLENGFCTMKNFCAKKFTAPGVFPMKFHSLVEIQTNNSNNSIRPAPVTMPMRKSNCGSVNINIKLLMPTVRIPFVVKKNVAQKIMVNYLQIQPGDSASVSFVESKRSTALALCKKLFKNKDLYPDPPREISFFK